MSYNGLPFDDSLIPSLQSVKDRIKLNKAAMIIIDGGVGEGKTTLACHIAEWYQPGWVENRSEELLAMGGKAFLKSLDVSVKKKDRVVVYDEAGDFNSRGALTYFNQNLNRVFETYRQTQKLIILCLPDSSDIDRNLFKKRIPRMVINTYDRNDKYGNYRVYSLWRAWYLHEKMKKLTVPPQAYSIVTPNLFGHFKDLDPEEREVIGKISMKGKRQIIQKSYLNQKGLIDIEEIGRRTGYSKASLYPKLRDLECESVGRKKYWDKSVVEKLLAEKKR